LNTVRNCMNKRLVSVIIPSYNHRQYIGAALDSILMQTYRPIEIVIVDDGSTDGSQETIKSWLEKNESANGMSFKFFSKRNSGAHSAINFGIKKSTGGIISILNSDDIYLPNRITEMAKPILSGKTKFTISLVKFIDDQGKALPVSDQRFEWYFNAVSTRFRYPSLSTCLLNKPVHVTSSNYMFSRELFSDLKGFRNYVWCHDYDFIMRACILTEPMMVSRHLLHYRMHASNSISSREQNTEMFAHEIRRILEDYFEEYSLKYKKRDTTNIFAPSPYNWPTRFKNLYRKERPFVKTYDFLSQLSLCNNFMFDSKSTEVGNKISPFLEHTSDDRDSLATLRPLHYLHQKNFSHQTDRRIKLLKLSSAKVVTNAFRPTGTLIQAQAKIDFPYYNRLGLLGVFNKDRLVAILRYQKSTGPVMTFKGFSSEMYSTQDIKKFNVCWLDFDGTSMICRWRQKPRFFTPRKPKNKTLSSGNLDMAFVDKHYLRIHGWSLMDRDLPETIELFINNKKINILPELEPREDLKFLMKNPGSCGVAGFRFYLPRQLLPSNHNLKVSIQSRARNGNISFSKKLDLGSEI
jgi:glycosyltransferase involved in cell wall biosynthesis